VSLHSRSATRWLHFAGTHLAAAAAAAALVRRRPVELLAVPLISYGVAWGSHLAIEKNRPATFAHPLWSLRGDLRMIGMMWQGRDDELTRIGPRPEHDRARRGRSDRGLTGRRIARPWRPARRGLRLSARCRLKLREQAPGDRRDLAHRGLERRAIALRGLPVSAHLADVLQGGRLDVIGGRGGLGSAQGLDASTHERRLAGARAPDGSPTIRRPVR